MEATTNKTELSKKTGFIIAVVGQLALLLLLVLYKLATFSSGTEVLLQLQPVDPRDVLRGDYVVLRYVITNVNGYASERVVNGDTVYVPLYKGSDKFWMTYGDVRKQLPGDTHGQIYIKGVVQSGGVNPAEAASPTNKGVPTFSNSQNLTIAYGIESYFIPENSGHQWDINTQDAYARVAIDKDGKAIVKQLYVNDKPWPGKK